MTEVRCTVAGEIDTIEILGGRDIHTVIEGIKEKAIRKAAEAGADPASTRIVEVANIPVQVRGRSTAYECVD